MSEYEYCGSELELFEKAINWKAYTYNNIKQYLGDTVLEVGSGFGGSTRILAQGTHSRWLCVEPDPTLSSRLESNILGGGLPEFCEIVTGNISVLSEEQNFDTILYMDVLEHIEMDRQEIENAARHLSPNGHLVVLCPAHQWLFSPFDEAIGHYRRYNKRMFGKFASRELRLERLWYLDCVGLLASLANSCLLRQRAPSKRQIWLWDKWMVPSSRWLDPMVGHRLGKSILGVWSLQT